MWQGRQRLKCCVYKLRNARLLAITRTWEEARWKPPLEPLERTWPHQHLNFSFIVSWTVRKQTCCFKTSQYMVICYRSLGKQYTYFLHLWSYLLSKVHQSIVRSLPLAHTYTFLILLSTIKIQSLTRES